LKILSPFSLIGNFDENAVEFQAAFDYISIHNLLKKMKILTDLIQSIQLKIYSSSKEFKKRNLPLDIGDVLNDASRVLICLPSEPANAQTAISIVNKISGEFPNWNITLMTNQQIASSFLQRTPHTVLTFSEEDVAKSGKPKKKYVERIFKTTFDVAIDMSIPFSFTNLVLTWLSGAQLRVGFLHEDREALYNFLIRHKADATIEHSYLSLVNYLRSFH
jgi:hypothetical protein